MELTGHLSDQFHDTGPFSAHLRLTKAKFGIHTDSAPCWRFRRFSFRRRLNPADSDFLLQESRPLEVGDLRFEILALPRSLSRQRGVVQRRERVVFAGECCLPCLDGRTDLPGGIPDIDALNSEKLLRLTTTLSACWRATGGDQLGKERRTNPFLVG